MRIEGALSPRERCDKSQTDIKSDWGLALAR